MLISLSPDLHPEQGGLLGPIQFITIISLFVGAHDVFLGLEHARKVLNLWVKPESCFLWFCFVFLLNPLTAVRGVVYIPDSLEEFLLPHQLANNCL